MFSAILMAAMTSTTITPQFFCKPHCVPVCQPAYVCCKPIVFYSCSGCYGSCYGTYGFYNSCYGGCFGSCYGCYGSVIVPSTSMSPVKGKGESPVKQAPPASPTAPKKADDLKKPAASAAPAKVTVELPANSKLFVDGVATESTGTKRVFSTPDLQTGIAFYYDLKVVFPDNTVKTAKLVVRAGEEATANFADSISTVSR